MQPFMFTKGFASEVLGSAAVSQPAPMRQTITTVEHVVGAHPAAWNLLFAITELLIGVGMLASRDGRFARVACRCSIAWGLGVWTVGEGFGGLLTGHAAASTGAPGAAALYVLLSVVAWPKPSARGVEEPLSACLLANTWRFVWLCGAALAVLPAQWGATGLGGQAAMGWMMSPTWAVHPTLAVATWLNALPPWSAAALSISVVTVLLAIAINQRRGKPTSPALLAGAGLAIVFWMFGQGFGGLSTGTATDVGTGPLVVVLAIAVSAALNAEHAEPPTPS
jgi:hypothetical protein